MEGQFLLVALFDLSEAAYNNEVHAIEELTRLTQDAQGHNSCQHVHLSTADSHVDYREAHDETTHEKADEVKELCNFVGARVSQP